MVLGTSATAAKVRYNLKNYDKVSLRLKKGSKVFLEDMAAKNGCSVNQYVLDSVFHEFVRSYNRDFACVVLREAVKYLARDLKGLLCGVYLEGFLVDGNWKQGLDAKLVCVVPEVSSSVVSVISDFVDFCNKNINDEESIRIKGIRIPRITFRVVSSSDFVVDNSMVVLFVGGLGVGGGRS